MSDMVVEVQLSNLSADTDEECGVIFRANDSDNCFAAYLDDGDDLVHLSKFVAGAETTIAIARADTLNQSPGKDYVWALWRTDDGSDTPLAYGTCLIVAVAEQA